MLGAATPTSFATARIVSFSWLPHSSSRRLTAASTSARSWSPCPRRLRGRSFMPPLSQKASRSRGRPGAVEVGAARTGGSCDGRSAFECGPADGPLMIFLHGWPGIALMWRAQMDAFAADGWHCVAPDLRGYGGSSAPAGNDAYTLEEGVADMAELHDHLGGNAAIWVGHDWGTMTPTSPTRAKHPMAAASRSRCCSSTAS